MNAFMDKVFLLSIEPASQLYHDFVENLPIIGYHCHLSTEEIYSDRRLNDITEL